MYPIIGAIGFYIMIAVALITIIISFFQERKKAINPEHWDGTIKGLNEEDDYYYNSNDERRNVVIRNG